MRVSCCDLQDKWRMWSNTHGARSCTTDVSSSGKEFRRQIVFLQLGWDMTTQLSAITRVPAEEKKEREEEPNESLSRDGISHRNLKLNHANDL